MEVLMTELCKDLLRAPMVHGMTWHAMDVSKSPAHVAREIENFVWEQQIPGSLSGLQIRVKPNLPWAEDHFQERVSRQPLNPPPSEAWWPFAMKANAVHKDENEKFSHTYPERFWPKQAGYFTLDTGEGTNAHGIRFDYGDLDDVVRLLVREPTSRQAFLPVWFPEDTGAVEGQRLPCSLGYQFMIRDGYLNVTYHMRSCDFVRHFRDDVYMAMRLGQWVVNEMAFAWETVDDPQPPLIGKLFMTITSLHCFKGDEAKMRNGDV